MCGIFWHLLTENSSENDIKDIKNQFQTIQHRGPDASAFQIINNECWGFHRLAIINPKPEGMQPFFSNTSILICNGEIYNYKDFNLQANSDCHVILKLLDDTIANNKSIQEVINSLDGDFAFIYKNNTSSSSQFIIARDHIGVCPLFYAVNNNGDVIAAASEVKALINLPNVSNVKVFPPGHVYINGTLKQYTRATNLSPLICVKEAESNIRNLLKNAVLKRIIHSDRKVGILCSGGVDSSIIACLVKELNICDMIHVFTMEYNNSNSEDTFYARLLCKKLGLQHTVFTFDNDDIVNNYDNVVRQCETYDPNTIRAAIPMYILAHKIAENTDVKVILSGEGADELFHGYNYFHMAPSPDLAQEESIRLLQNLHMFDLLRAERCFLSAGLEVRVPFLDKYLVEYILSLPGDLFNQPTLGIQFSEKELLRNTFKYMVDLESIRILTRPKERFSDGCGFTYIPTLLNFLSGGIVSKLNEKLNYEKKYVNNIFNANYPNCNHLIINRTMPFWTISGRPSNNDNGNILECI